MSGTEIPIGTALVLCDQVIAEEGTHKKTLVGTFNNIKVSALPCTYPAMAVFASLTNGRGLTRVTLRCTTVGDSKLQFELPLDVAMPDPGHVSELVFNLRNVALTVSGIYCLELCAAEEPLLETRFSVQLSPP